MVKCIVLGEKENHPYLMILFVCLILCSPESHSHSTSIQLAPLPMLSAFFMGQSVRFSSRERILLPTAAPPGCSIFHPEYLLCYKTITLEFCGRERKENWSMWCVWVNFSSVFCKGSERLCLRNHKGHVSEVESMAGRDGHLAQKVSGSSPCPWLVFTVILSSDPVQKPSDLSGCKGYTHWFHQNDVMFLVSGLLSLLCVREAASSARPLIAPKWKCPDNLMLPLSIFVVFIFNWSCKGFLALICPIFPDDICLPWLAFYSLSPHTNFASSSYQCAHQNSCLRG